MAEQKPKRVFLIDSMSHIFRAYFAPMGAKQEPLRNSKGQVTQAVFVFTNILRKLINDEKPDYIAAVFDTSHPTFRHDSFADYKANRDEMPEDLASQIPYIVGVCEALNVPILKMDGYEADDIIGTLAQECEKQKLQAVIVSNDKDLCQLVRDPYIIGMRQNSQNIKRKVPVPATEWCDEAWVENKFGLPPSKIIDLLGLMGDAVDNIPGAPGIGEKGALKLILEYGSAEEAMRCAEEVTHKTYRESLANNQDIIRQSLELATVHKEVPIKLDLDLLKMREPNRPAAYALFREMEFTALTKEFSDSAPLFDGLPTGDGSAAVTRKYEIIRTRTELDTLIRRLWERESFAISVDDSNSPANSGSFDKLAPRGIAIAQTAGTASYIDLENFEGGSENAVRPLRDTFTNEFLNIYTHDYKRILAALIKLGITPTNVKEDVMIAAYLIDSGRPVYDLPHLVRQNLSSDFSGAAHEGWEDAQWLACENADFTFQLVPLLSKTISENGLDKVYREIEVPVIPVLYRMEMAGMGVDISVLTKFSAFISKELATLSTKIFELAGREFNISSPKQVGEILSELNIETGRKTATGQISTSKDVLAELAETYELPRLVIDYREMERLKTTYADTLPNMISADGRIHGKLNQTVAATGRLSSTDPNLQNIPIRTELGQEIRRAFVPASGCKLISADYSQLELRILAHITHDEVMMEAYKNNEDIHNKTARLVFGAKSDADLKEKRRLAKIVNFGIAYAVEAFGLSQRVGLSKSEAKQVIEDYYNTYKGIKKYMDDTPEKAREQGYITTIFGRRRLFPSINDRNYNVRSRAEREAINMPIQGTASDIVKIAMLRVDEALQQSGLKAKMLMQVHDELLLEAPEDEIKKVTEIVKREMESAAKLDVPLIAEIGVGENWKDAK